MPSSPTKPSATVPNLNLGEALSPGGTASRAGGSPGKASNVGSDGKPRKKNDRPDLEARDTYFTDKEAEVEDVADALSMVSSNLHAAADRIHAAPRSKEAIRAALREADVRLQQYFDRWDKKAQYLIMNPAKDARKGQSSLLDQLLIKVKTVEFSLKNKEDAMNDLHQEHDALKVAKDEMQRTLEHELLQAEEVAASAAEQCDKAFDLAYTMASLKSNNMCIVTQFAGWRGQFIQDKIGRLLTQIKKNDDMMRIFRKRRQKKTKETLESMQIIQKRITMEKIFQILVTETNKGLAKRCVGGKDEEIKQLKSELKAKDSEIAAQKTKMELLQQIAKDGEQLANELLKVRQELDDMKLKGADWIVRYEELENELKAEQTEHKALQSECYKRDNDGTNYRALSERFCNMFMKKDIEAKDLKEKLEKVATPGEMASLYTHDEYMKCIQRLTDVEDMFIVLQKELSNADNYRTQIKELKNVLTVANKSLQDLTTTKVRNRRLEDALMLVTGEMDEEVRREYEKMKRMGMKPPRGQRGKRLTASELTERWMQCKQNVNAIKMENRRHMDEIQNLRRQRHVYKLNYDTERTNHITTMYRALRMSATVDEKDVLVNLEAPEFFERIPNDNQNNVDECDELEEIEKAQKERNKGWTPLKDPRAKTHNTNDEFLEMRRHELEGFLEGILKEEEEFMAERRKAQEEIEKLRNGMILGGPVVSDMEVEKHDLSMDEVIQKGLAMAEKAQKAKDGREGKSAGSGIETFSDGTGFIPAAKEHADHYVKSKMPQLTFNASDGFQRSDGFKSAGGFSNFSSISSIPAGSTDGFRTTQGSFGGPNTAGSSNGFGNYINQTNIPSPGGKNKMSRTSEGFARGTGTLRNARLRPNNALGGVSGKLAGRGRGGGASPSRNPMGGSFSEGFGPGGTQFLDLNKSGRTTGGNNSTLGPNKFLNGRVKDSKDTHASQSIHKHVFSQSRRAAWGGSQSPKKPERPTIQSKLLAQKKEKENLNTSTQSFRSNRSGRRGKGGKGNDTNMRKTHDGGFSPEKGPNSFANAGFRSNSLKRDRSGSIGRNKLGMGADSRSGSFSPAGRSSSVSQSHSFSPGARDTGESFFSSVSNPNAGPRGRFGEFVPNSGLAALQRSPLKTTNPKSLFNTSGDCSPSIRSDLRTSTTLKAGQHLRAGLDGKAAMGGSHNSGSPTGGSVNKGKSPSPRHRVANFDPGNYMHSETTKWRKPEDISPRSKVGMPVPGSKIPGTQAIEGLSQTSQGFWQPGVGYVGADHSAGRPSTHAVGNSPQKHDPMRSSYLFHIIEDGDGNGKKGPNGSSSPSKPTSKSPSTVSKSSSKQIPGFSGAYEDPHAASRGILVNESGELDRIVPPKRNNPTIPFEQRAMAAKEDQKRKAYEEMRGYMGDQGSYFPQPFEGMKEGKISEREGYQMIKHWEDLKEQADQKAAEMIETARLKKEEGFLAGGGIINEGAPPIQVTYPEVFKSDQNDEQTNKRLPVDPRKEVRDPPPPGWKQVPFFVPELSKKMPDRFSGTFPEAQPPEKKEGSYMNFIDPEHEKMLEAGRQPHEPRLPLELERDLGKLKHHSPEKRMQDIREFYDAEPPGRAAIARGWTPVGGGGGK